MKHPKLLILSGMHGDEYEVIDCVTGYLENNKEHLPEYLCIPEVSPSAVLRKKRTNIFGHDVNRQFFDPPADPEVKSVMKMLMPHHFVLSLNFHEDPDLSHAFYLYDSGHLREDQLTELRKRIIATGAGLHTGIDDPLDANLGLYVEKGYVSSPWDELEQSAGFSLVWLARHRIVNRSLVIEIPGRAPIPLKRALVAAVFSFFLTPAFGF